jgi:putative flippase GtrA
MLRLARRALRDERARFLAVGAFNTVFAYLLFVVLELLLGRPLLSLALSYAVATVVAFGLHRRLTFGVNGREGILVDFLRFESVYIVMLAVNAGLLWLLVDGARWPSWLAQALCLVITTAMSYLGHKTFSFRRVTAR